MYIHYTSSFYIQYDRSNVSEIAPLIVQYTHTFQKGIFYKRNYALYCVYIECLVDYTTQSLLQPRSI